MVNLFFIFSLTFLALGIRSRRVDFELMVAGINLSQTLWHSELTPEINFDDDEDMMRRVGTNIDFKPPTLTTNRPRTLQTLTTNTAAPLYPFALDLRVKYPLCRSISTIRNQLFCGGCWAFGSMNSLSDRYCIAKSTANTVNEKFFSAQDVLECCTACNGGSGNGCRGGIPFYAMLHARDIGVSSGEAPSIGGLCKPYFLDINPVYPPPVPTCEAKCTNSAGFSVPYQLDKTKIDSIKIGFGEQDMIAALNNGGSISAAMLVYQDFFTYKSGIYRYTSGVVVGGHSVRIIGYGEENGVKYWLVANSWGVHWGDNGFFKIVRGTNECMIESAYFVAGIFK